MPMKKVTLMAVVLTSLVLLRTSASAGPGNDKVNRLTTPTLHLQLGGNGCGGVVASGGHDKGKGLTVRYGQDGCGG
jgi:hypothetical protein